MIDYSFVGGIHGNELLPYFAVQSVGMSVLLGNPVAAAFGKRFVEEDLNRCFGKDGTTLEHGRARELMQLLPPNRPVIDLHTFSCESDPFAIVVDPAYLPLAKALGLSHVVLMSFDIKEGGSLIGHCGGVSIEVGHHEDPASFERTLEVIQRLASVRDVPPAKVYEVMGIVREPGDYANFVPHPKGFVPILAGEQAYDHYGLLGRRIE